MPILGFALLGFMGLQLLCKVVFEQEVINKLKGEDKND